MEMLCKYGVQTTFYFPVLKRFSTDLAATADWTPATGDTKVSKDGGNVANTSNNPAAVGGTGSILWSLTLTATELQAARVVVQIVDSATKAIEDQTIIIATYGNASAAHPFDLGTASTAQTGDSFARLAAPAGASVSADIAAVKAVLPTALVSGRIDSSVGAMAANVVTAAAIADAAIDRATFAADTGLQNVRANTAQAGASGSITLDASASSVTDFYKDTLVYLTGGTGVGQTRLISSYNGSTKVATIATNWATNPDNTTTFAILPLGQSDLALWEGTAPNALVSGRVDSSVGAMAANVLTATAINADAITAAKVADGTIDAATFAAGAINAAAIATDAITAAKIAADAIGASELAADAVTEIQTGLATSTALATVQADTDDIQTRLPSALVGGKMDSHVNDIAASAITATSIATDAITAAKIAADAIGASELAADAVTEIQTGLATSAALATVQSDTDDIQTRLPAALVGGRMDASVGAMAADVVTAAAIATDAIGSAEVAASAVTKIQSGLSTASALAIVQADTDDIQTRLPAALVGGRMDSSVGAMAAGTVTAAAVATDAIDADALAADAVAEIQAGLATSAAVAALPTATQNADSVLTRALSAVEGSAASRSLAWAIAKLTNKVSLSGGTLSIKKTDDSTDLFTQAVVQTPGTDPVTSVDTN